MKILELLMNIFVFVIIFIIIGVSIFLILKETNIQVEDFEEIPLKSKCKKYRVSHLPERSIKLEWNGYGYHNENIFKEMMLQVLEIESPIEKELLFKRVLHSIGVRKLGRRIESFLQRHYLRWGSSSVY